MDDIHIGNRIKEAVEEARLSVAQFGDKIGLTRDGANKLFKKKTISVSQLDKIGRVLNVNFFSLYSIDSGEINEDSVAYGNTLLKTELDRVSDRLDALSRQVKHLTDAVEKLANNSKTD